MLFPINNSNLYYEKNVDLINEYYQMIINVIKKILHNNPDWNINISLCNNNYDFLNDNKTIKININWEHTIIKKGAIRGVCQETPSGKLIDNNNETYLVRIYRFEDLNNADIIIDYSNPNIYNVKNCEMYTSFSNKHIYISSSIYDSYFIKENRNIHLLTTFIDCENPKRKALLGYIKRHHINHTNINNCFEKKDLQNLYKNTKVLINIHQTFYHHTFEELRVLPALQCGVIVICENSPLNELIPYNDYIIWSSYDKILEKAQEVLNNYDHYHNLIFNKEKRNILNDFDTINYNNLTNEISKHL